jgi:formylglycine-generating enzyme required for sulfatase activity
MAGVFISYSHRDLEIARVLHDSFSAAGIVCWRDERWLQTGDDYAEEITKAIRDCDALVLLLSPASNSSDYVAIEAALAHRFNRPIFPILVEGTDIGDRLLPYVVRLHMNDLRTGGPGQLTQSLGAALQRKATPPSTHLDTPEPPQTATPAVPVSTKPDRSAALVTNEQYRAFIDAAPRRRASRVPTPSAPAEWGAADLPVLGISWDDAIAYCDWVGARLPVPGDNPGLASDIGVADRAAPIYEWWDAGTEERKQIREPGTAAVVALIERRTKRADVGFRVADVDIPSARQWIRVERGRWTLGSDAAAFATLAGMYRVHSALAGPVLARGALPCIVAAYSISQTPVTNEEYFAFTQATGRRWPVHWDAMFLGRFGRPFGQRLASQPVVNVSEEDAQAYCIWSHTRLPSWMEWERVAGGPERHPYPWGRTYSSLACNSIESERGALASAYDYRSGDSAEGARQMCGNVAEWVLGPRGEAEVKGGSYRLACEIWGLAYAFRNVDSPQASPDIGFRVAGG